MDVRIRKIIAALNRMYPHPKPFLNFRSPFESLVATILSAQCTDERVNKVTPALFQAAGTPESMAALDQKTLVKLIRSTGFYRAKARNIKHASRMLAEKYCSKVPSSLEKLEELPGVGRKTASVVLCQAFGIPAFPVDRHVLRVANRLELAKAENPDETDRQLRKNIPKKYWIRAHLQLISLGRSLCRPKPRCKDCPLLPLCPYGKRRML